MQILGKSIVIFTVLVQFVYSATVDAKVSTTEVLKGNEVKLHLYATGEDVKFPDLHVVGKISVANVSVQKSNNLAFINGEMKSEKRTTKTFGFFPKKDMTIPSYSISVEGKSYQTKPIDIKVVASKVPLLKQDSLYSFVLKSEKKQVLVGESFVVNLFVSISDRIQGAKLAEFTDPNMQGFFSKALGEPRQYRQNGYTIVEKQYLLTPKQEGHLVIGPASAKLGESDTRRRDFFGRYATQWYDIASNNLEVEVLPQSQKSDLIGEFTIDATVDAREVKANKPVNLTVKVEGEGNLEDFEFPTYEIEGVTVYSDKAKIDSKVVDGKLQSSYTKSFAMISEKDFIIPKRNFTVWNPISSKLENLKISSYKIKVKEEKNALTASPSSDSQEIPSKVEEASQPTIDVVKSKMVEEIAWWMLAVVFVAGMLVMYLLTALFSKIKNRGKRYRNDEALQILYPHINESSEVEEMVRKLYIKKGGDKSVVVDKKELKALIQKYQK